MNFNIFTKINHKADHYDVDMSDQDWYDAAGASEFPNFDYDEKAVIERIESVAMAIAEES